jgi:hypothetical protein
VETLFALDDSSGDGADVRGNALALLPLYTLRDGTTLLKDDLRSLGILLGESCGAENAPRHKFTPRQLATATDNPIVLGSLDVCADLVGTSDGLLDQIAVEFAVRPVPLVLMDAATILIMSAWCCQLP